MNDYVAIVKRKDSDELQHWKYIKREKKNGKWVYYYDKEQLKDDLGFDERERLKEAENERDFSKGLYDFAENRRSNPSAMDIKNAGGQEKWDAYINEQVNRTRERAAKAERVAKQYMSDYAKTPLGKLESAVSKGKSFFNKLFKKK